MRDPKRIDDILNRLKVVWKAHPDLRLSQMLLNCQGNDRGNIPFIRDLYYVEDDQMIGMIERVHSNVRS